MAFGKWAATGALALLLTGTVGFAGDQARAEAASVLGYYTPDDASYQALTTYHDYLTGVSTDSFNMTTAGGVVGDVPTQALSYAKSHALATYACFSNFGTSDFDPDLAHIILTNSSVRQKAVQNIVNTVKKNGYTGVNIDFESVMAGDRNALTSFVKSVSDALRPAGYQVIVSVPAKTEDDPSNGWSGAYNYAALGGYVDFLQVMTYDEHGPWSEPGSVASKGWIEDSLKFSVSQVAASKVLIGLPDYGYDWNLTTNREEDHHQIAGKNIAALLQKTGATVKWDAATSSPYFNYTDSQGSKHVVWYENARSIEEKAHLVPAYHLGGASVWALGMEDASFWKAVQTGMNK